MKKTPIIIASSIILTFLATAFFSMAMTINVILNFQDLEVYNQITFREDIKLSIIVMISSVIGIAITFYFLFKQDSLNKIFGRNKTS